MARKTAEETAAAAAELYANKDSGDLLGAPVEVEPSKNLSTVVSVRLNAADLEVIEKAAAAAGVKLSAYLRQAALEKVQQPDMIRRDEVVGQLRKVMVSFGELEPDPDATKYRLSKSVEDTAFSGTKVCQGRTCIHLRGLFVLSSSPGAVM